MSHYDCRGCHQRIDRCLCPPRLTPLPSEVPAPKEKVHLVLDSIDANVCERLPLSTDDFVASLRAQEAELLAHGSKDVRLAAEPYGHDGGWDLVFEYSRPETAEEKATREKREAAKDKAKDKTKNKALEKRRAQYLRLKAEFEGEGKS